MWKNPALSQPFPISKKCDLSKKARKNFWGLKYKKKSKKTCVVFSQGLAMRGKVKNGTSFNLNLQE